MVSKVFLSDEMLISNSNQGLHIKGDGVVGMTDIFWIRDNSSARVQSVTSRVTGY